MFVRDWIFEIGKIALFTALMRFSLELCEHLNVQTCQKRAKGKLRDLTSVCICPPGVFTQPIIRFAFFGISESEGAFIDVACAFGFAVGNWKDQTVSTT